MATISSDQQTPSQDSPRPGRVDTHHHYFPKDVPELAPEFAHGAVTFGVGFTGVFPTSVEDHIRFMDANSIRTTVLSPSIKNRWHQDMPPVELVQLCEDSLQAQIRYVNSNPSRFGCFALLPLPHIDETLAFIRKAVKLPVPPDGFNLSTQIGNRYLGDKLFDPVLAALSNLKAVLFVHPADSNRPENLPFGPFLQEFAFDTCRVITNILVSGVLTRYPDITFIFSHAGGAFPYLADRIGAQHIDEAIAKANSGMRLRDLLASKKLYFDTALSAPYQFSVLHELGVTPDRLLYGSDWPYTERTDSTGATTAGYDAPLKSRLFSAEQMLGVAAENALRLFPRLKREWGRK